MTLLNSRVKLGINLYYSDAKMALPIKQIQRAEELGYDAVWTAEAYGSDALSPLAYIGALTRRIKLGTAICQIAARTPANFAMTIQTIDQMVGEGRLMAGLGVSGPQIVEGWYGQPWGKPNYKIRDYIAIVRKILAREEPVTHDGKEIVLPYRGEDATGLGKPLKSILHGNPNIPLLLGTFSDTNMRMTGEIADGWIGDTKWTPTSAPRFSALLQEGLARRTDGRTLEDFLIYATLSVRVDDDVSAAMAPFKKEIALYVGGMGAKGKNFHNDMMVAAGYGAEAQRIQELYLAGHKAEAEATVPDEFVDDQALIGPAARIKERWKPWEDTAAYGLKGLSLNRPTDEAVELMAQIVGG